MYSMKYELESGRQQSNQSVTENYSSIMKLFDRCDPNKNIAETEQVMKFISGHQPNITSMVDSMIDITESMSHHTLPRAYRLACNAERALPQISRSYQR